jgi:hypothetical protein
MKPETTPQYMFVVRSPNGKKIVGAFNTKVEAKKLRDSMNVNVPDGAPKFYVSPGPAHHAWKGGERE